jgi:hypothetical protein
MLNPAPHDIWRLPTGKAASLCCRLVTTNTELANLSSSHAEKPTVTRVAPVRTQRLDCVADTLYRDYVKGHQLGWIYVTLPRQPKTKGSASSAPSGDI